MPKLSTQNFKATKITFVRAKRLRKKMTQGEKLLWHALSGNKLKGYYFRRQHPLGKYIADFYCHKIKLVIEIDGPIHDTPERKRKDKSRDKIMNELGITILRFKDDEMFENLDKVVLEIEKNLP